MHQSGVYHGDVYSRNIMMNSSLDSVFIDFDTSIIDNCVSHENICFQDKISTDEKISSTLQLDKLDMIRTYLNYLLSKRFDGCIVDYLNIDSLGLPKSIHEELIACLSWESHVKRGYYFEDIIDELIRIGYESPVLCAKKVLKKYNIAQYF